MKNILITLFLIIYPLNSMADSKLISEFKNKFRNTETMIFIECASDARYVKKLVKQRNAGVPLRGLIDWVLLNEDNVSDKHTIKTVDVLYQIILMTLIYNNPHLTPEKIYTEYNEHCIVSFFEMFEILHNYEKQKKRQRK